MKLKYYSLHSQKSPYVYFIYFIKEKKSFISFNDNIRRQYDTMFPSLSLQFY